MLKNILLILFAVGLYTCKTPYTPTPITATTNYLVVEGLININDSTYINLSRTVTVSAKTTAKPELKATVTIEDDKGGSYLLKELGAGVYAAPSFNLSASNQYRLRVKTSGNSTYTSDFAAAKVAPPIDSILTQIQSDGVHIAVNAHDATNNTRYYRWTYSETWQFTSFYWSFYMSPGGNALAVVPRTNDIYHCWGYDNSANISLGNTSSLSQDILTNSPITFLSSSSEKLSVRYSIQLKQYALTKDAYDYWTLLRKNTEQLGSVFDSQPSASMGNIHNINNPAEPVIGYISAGSVTKKRIFIDVNQLPANYRDDYVNNNAFRLTCAVDTLSVVQRDPKTGNILSYPEQESFIRTPAKLIPIDVIIPYNPVTLAGTHTGTEPICADCTLRGTTTKPSYWK